MVFVYYMVVFIIGLLSYCILVQFVYLWYIYGIFMVYLLQYVGLLLYYRIIFIVLQYIVFYYCIIVEWY